MLYQLVGAPGAGKTTIAANVFARLKAMGVPAEFISEKAREMIARQKYYLDAITDSTQIEIMRAQALAEASFASATDAPVICDSSTLLTMLYFNHPSKHMLDEAKLCVDMVRDHMRYVFYCPVRETREQDSNRIHDLDFSKGIDNRIVPLFREHLPDIKVVELKGPIERMVMDVLNVILSTYKFN